MPTPLRLTIQKARLCWRMSILALALLTSACGGRTKPEIPDPLADYRKRILSPGAAFKDYKAPAPTIAKSKGHYTEWLQAAQTGEEALCNFNYSGRLIEHNLLGNAAFRAGRALNYDGKTGKIDDVDDLSGFLTKSYREGWSPFK